MHKVEPKAFIVAETALSLGALSELLEELGVSDWSTDAPTSGEELIELMGRLCYKSFAPDLNPNVTRVRQGNAPYIENILNVKHGSVLEHAHTSVIFTGVSRIFTHELVRHRAGTAFSQESMRFVRLDNIPIYVPDLKEEFAELGHLRGEMDRVAFANHMQEAFTDHLTLVTQQAEANIRFFAELLDNSEKAVPFRLKKKITSALRRMAPSGHATNSGVTANHRAWRHMIELRTAVTPDGERTAEQEIHDVFVELGNAFKARYPNIYQDMEIILYDVNNVETCHFKNSKV